MNCPILEQSKKLRQSFVIVVVEIWWNTDDFNTFVVLIAKS
jgi:hypothetical protein